MISNCSISIALAATFAFLVQAQAAPQPGLNDPGFLRLKYVAVLVRDYEEGFKWYTEVLGWRKIEDRAFGPDPRWIVVAPQGQTEIGIVLDRPSARSPKSGMKNYSDRIGKETTWVFQVADCAKLFEVLSKRGVKFVASPKTQPWGTSQATFEDLYGNIFVVESLGNAQPR
jgi:predicted enzyme related to lactoylglutathione lyase